MISPRKRGGVWYFRYTDGDAIKRERRGCPDKRATEEMARAAESEAARVRAGLVDPFAPHRHRPIGDHLADHLAFLRSKGDMPKHVADVEARVRAVPDGTDARRLGDINGPRVAAWPAASRKAGLAGEEGGLSGQTSDHYLR